MALTTRDIALIVFSVTRNWTAAEGNEASLEACRVGLAALIARTDSGEGFVKPATLEEATVSQETAGIYARCLRAAETVTRSTDLHSRQDSYVIVKSEKNPIVSETASSYSWLASSNPTRIGMAQEDGKTFSLFQCTVDRTVRSGIYEVPKPKKSPTLAKMRGANSTMSRALMGALFLASLAFFCLAMILAGIEGQGNLLGSSRFYLFPNQGLFLCMAAILVMLGVIGYAARNTIAGALIDARGRVSLSATQFALWTVVILGTYAAAAFWNIGFHFAEIARPPAATQSANASNPAKPGDAAGTVTSGDPSTAESGGLLPDADYRLWLLLGIVGGIPVAGKLMLNNRRDDDTEDADDNPNGGQMGAHAQPNVDAAHVSLDGGVDVRTDPNAWSILDLVFGELSGNRGAVDMTRVQHVLFTLLTLMIFIGLAVDMFHTQATVHKLITTLPKIDSNFLFLLTASHALALANKATSGN